MTRCGPREASQPKRAWPSAELAGTGHSGVQEETLGKTRAARRCDSPLAPDREPCAETTPPGGRLHPKEGHEALLGGRRWQNVAPRQLALQPAQQGVKPRASPQKPVQPLLPSKEPPLTNYPS